MPNTIFGRAANRPDWNRGKHEPTQPGLFRFMSCDQTQSITQIGKIRSGPQITQQSNNLFEHKYQISLNQTFLTRQMHKSIDLIKYAYSVAREYKSNGPSEHENTHLRIYHCISVNNPSKQGNEHLSMSCSISF